MIISHSYESIAHKKATYPTCEWRNFFVIVKITCIMANVFYVLKSFRNNSKTYGPFTAFVPTIE